MPNFLQVFANNAQFLLFVLVFLVPMLGGLYRWIETQRERRRRQTDADRRRLEALRTGRFESPHTAAPAPVRTGPTREDVAVRRQREMQERLRQRLEQQRRAGQPGAPQTVPPRQPTASSTGSTTATRPTGAPRPPIGARPGGPATVRQAPPPGRPFPQQQRSRGQQRQPQQPPTPARLAKARPQQIAMSPALQPRLGDSVAREEIGSAREAASLQTHGPVVRIGPGLSVQRLREAVVLREVLDQPLALREPDSEIFT